MGCGCHVNLVTQSRVTVTWCVTSPLTVLATIPTLIRWSVVALKLSSDSLNQWISLSYIHCPVAWWQLTFIYHDFQLPQTFVLYSLFKFALQKSKERSAPGFKDFVYWLQSNDRKTLMCIQIMWRRNSKSCLNIHVFY